MEKRIKVVQYGLGAMGTAMVKLMLTKAKLDCVGAISASGRYCGVDLGDALGLGEHLGISVNSSLAPVLEETKPEVMLHATVSTMIELIPEVLSGVRAGLNVISVAEELAYPWEQSPDLASELDRVAKEYGVTVLGTGINPGFLMDLLPLTLSGICACATSVRVRRVNDFSVYGQSVMKHIGANLTAEAFESGLREGSVVLHVGLPESLQLVGRGLGWKLDQFQEERHAVVSRSDRSTDRIKIQAGRVCGFRQIAVGRGQGGKIELEIIGIISPNPSEDGVLPGTWIEIEGDPSISAVISGGICQAGDLGTAAHAVNSIPAVVDARPGLLTIGELPVVSCLP